MLWQTAPFHQSKVSTIIVDAHRSVAEMVSMLLDRERDRFAVTGEATSDQAGSNFSEDTNPLW